MKRIMWWRNEPTWTGLRIKSERPFKELTEFFNCTFISPSHSAGSECRYRELVTRESNP